MPQQEIDSLELKDDLVLQDESRSDDGFEKASESELAVEFWDLPLMETSLHSIPAEYPPLPKDHKKCNRHYVLGWNISREWLEAFGRKYYPDQDLVYSIGWRNMGMNEPKIRSGYRPLHNLYVLPEDVPTPPEGAPVPSPLDFVIAVAFTASSYLYFHRPTEVQYNWLCEVLGGRPRWYRDSCTKKDFSRHEIPSFGC